MNALVTGGGGFIGSALIYELLQRGFKVSSFSRSDYPDLRSKGVEVKRGNLSDSKVVSDACEGIDIIFHVASKTGFWGTYQEYYKTNVIGTQNIVSACRDKNIKWLIYTSSASVVFDGNDIKWGNESLPYPSRPISYYTGTKAEAEKYVLTANSSTLKTIALRPHIVIGPGDNHLIPRILERAKAGKLRQIGNGRNMVDISYIDNVVEAHMAAVKSLMHNPDVSGKPYFISNGEPVVLWDFMNLILERAGVKLVRKRIPSALAFLLSGLEETLFNIFLIQKEPLLTSFLVHELSRSHYFDISAARKYLDYSPSVSNLESLDKMFG
jgi:nucleoside-diphosphate-sugar epimerase